VTKHKKIKKKSQIWQKGMKQVHVCRNKEKIISTQAEMEMEVIGSSCVCVCVCVCNMICMHVCYQNSAVCRSLTIVLRNPDMSRLI